MDGVSAGNIGPTTDPPNPPPECPPNPPPEPVPGCPPNPPPEPVPPPVRVPGPPIRDPGVLARISQRFRAKQNFFGQKTTGELPLRSDATSGQARMETPEAILRRRYASGEIDTDEFERRLSTLREGREASELNDTANPGGRTSVRARRAATRLARTYGPPPKPPRYFAAPSRI